MKTENQVLENLIISKFGGSAVGVDGVLIPTIIRRINELKKDSKVIAVFSAPLTTYNGKQRSLTDIALEIGRMAEKGESVSIDILKKPYQKIVELIDKTLQSECNRIIDSFLAKAQACVNRNTTKKRVC